MLNVRLIGVLSIFMGLLSILSSVLKVSFSMASQHRMPVYYISHGGPTFMYPEEEGGDAGAYKQIEAIGKEITTTLRPKAIVIFSAHWQTSEKNLIEVSINTGSDLIYDFYGFPKYMYKETFEHSGSIEVAEKVIELLTKNGVKTKKIDRPIDHGVWVPFKVAFRNHPLNDIPIVQVSLYHEEDPLKHYDLGKALAPLRDENIVVIGSGMSVHNLRDLWVLGTDKPAPYSITFDEALKEAVTKHEGDARKTAMLDLCQRPDARKAHPTFDHLLPIHVAAGVAGDDVAKRLYSNQVGSVAWGQYRFGDIS